MRKSDGVEGGEGRTAESEMYQRPRRELRQDSIDANWKRGEAGDRDLFGEKAEGHRSCRSMQGVRTVEILFM
jgi:hypothetical protein